MKCSFAKKITALLLTAVVAVTVFGSVFKGTVRAEETGIRGYVERLYSIVLGRQPDPNGIDYWENRMKNGTTAADCAAGFFNSDEFRSKQLSDEEYVLVLYRAILGREADPTGLEGWTSSLKDGYPRARVLQGFISSDEFKGICSRYGVTPGNYNLTDLLDIHYVEAQFVKRAYSLILGRTADETGLRDWVGKISSGKISASQMVRGFILSDEYRGKNTTSDEYVEMLYNVILSRTSDPTGKQGWVELIDRKHVTRDYVLKGFVDSDEFSSLCAKYGVNKGTIDLSDPRDWNPDVNVFTVNAYMAVNQAMPSDKEIGYWAGEFAKGRAGKVLLESLFNTPGFKKLSSEEQIRRIYAACLGRKPSDTEVSEALKVVGKKGIDEFKKNIFHSQEFEKYCKGNSVGAIYDVGINVINGAIYYFDGTAMRSGWQRVNGQKYYFDPSNILSDGQLRYEYCNGICEVEPEQRLRYSRKGDDMLVRCCRQRNYPGRFHTQQGRTLEMPDERRMGSVLHPDLGQLPFPFGMVLRRRRYLLAVRKGVQQAWPECIARMRKAHGLGCKVDLRQLPWLSRTCIHFG